MREPGTIVDGRYRLESVLGEGGHATVWGATQVLTNKRVALKLFKEKGVRNLVEARAATHVEHRHVIAVHDVFLDEDGGWIMAMEWLEGESLAATLTREGKLPLARVIELFLPALDALEQAHRSRIVHRDLKPSNFFVAREPDGSERLVLLDFGVARVLDETLGETAHTVSGTLLGTPHYMAPEQVFGESSADTRADLWSLGIVLCECLTGKRPTEALNVGGVLKRITMRDVTRLRELDPSLPPMLLDHADALLSFDPEKRPTSVSETIRVLADLRDGRAAPRPRRAASRNAALALLVLAATTVAGVTLVRSASRAERSPARELVSTTALTADAVTFPSAVGDQDASPSSSVEVVSSNAAPRGPPRVAPAPPSARRRFGVIETNPYE